MPLIDIVNTFNRISGLIGLPPIVLIFTIAVFFFVSILAMVVLIKIRSIRNDLIDVNRGLDSFKQRIQAEVESIKVAKHKIISDSENFEFESHKQAPDKSDRESTFELPLSSENGWQDSNRAEDRSNHQREELIDTREERPDVKKTILNILNETGRPISYSEITKYFSKDSDHYDFDAILEILEKLKNEGIVVGQIYAGKLYFQINLKK